MLYMYIYIYARLEDDDVCLCINQTRRRKHSRNKLIIVIHCVALPSSAIPTRNHNTIQNILYSFAVTICYKHAKQIERVMLRRIVDLFTWTTFIHLFRASAQHHRLDLRVIWFMPWRSLCICNEVWLWWDWLVFAYIYTRTHDVWQCVINWLLIACGLNYVWIMFGCYFAFSLYYDYIMLISICYPYSIVNQRINIFELCIYFDKWILQIMYWSDGLSKTINSNIIN